jgi:hypothetical protein
MERLTVEGLKAQHLGVEVEVANKVTVTPTPAFRRAVRPASEASVALLRRLVAERKPDTDPAFTEAVIAEGQTRVSRAIDTLKTLPKVEVAPAPRTNRYPGKCEDCGTTVEAEAGTLAKADNGRWEVVHLPGGCPVTDFPFPLGRYAVDNTEDEVRFYAATVEGLFVLASDNLHPVHPSAQARIIEAIAADPEEASRRYGRHWKVCGRCGRGLTDTTPGGSRDQGIGPICASKGF